MAPSISKNHPLYTILFDKAFDRAIWYEDTAHMAWALVPSERAIDENVFTFLYNEMMDQQELTVELCVAETGEFLTPQQLAEFVLNHDLCPYALTAHTLDSFSHWELVDLDVDDLVDDLMIDICHNNTPLSMKQICDLVLQRAGR